MSRRVREPNRRLAFAACLMLAYKFHEPEGGRLASLFVFVDTEWAVSRREVRAAPLSVAAAAAPAAATA